MDWLIGTQAVVWLQQFRTPALDSFWHLMAALGDETFYIVALAFIYWVVGRSAGVRMTLVMLTHFWLNSFLKYAIGQPRPSGPGVTPLEGLTDPGLPSGHAQGTTTFWGFLGLSYQRRWIWWVGGTAVLLTSISRLYLGMHTPLHLLTGYGFALAFLAVAWFAVPVLQRWLETGHWAVSACIVLVYAGLLYTLHRSLDTAVPLGAFVGFGLGHVIGTRLYEYDSGGPAWWQIVKTVVGLALLLGLRVGLKPLMPAGYFGDALRYGLIGCGATLLVPWIFSRLQPGRGANAASGAAAG